MAGTIQNEDVKSEAELISAGGAKAQLINDTKIYVTSGTINKTLDDAIADGDISGTTDLPDFTVNNNKTTPTNITGLVFDKLETKSARIYFDLHRETDTNELDEVGEMFVVYRPKSDVWAVSVYSNLDDGEVTFTITSAGQVQYISSSLAGASYIGNLKLRNITRISI